MSLFFWFSDAWGQVKAELWHHLKWLAAFAIVGCSNTDVANDDTFNANVQTSGCRAIDWMQSQIAEQSNDLNRWKDPFSVLAHLRNLSQDTSTALVAQSYSTQRAAVSLLKPRVIVLWTGPKKVSANDMVAPYHYLLASPWKRSFSCLRSASSPEQMVEGIAVCDGEKDQRVRLADGRFESPWRFFRISRETKKWAIESDIGLSAEGGVCFGCHQGMPIVSGYPLWENWFLPIRNMQPDSADRALLLQFIKRNRSATAQLLPDLSEGATNDQERVTGLFSVLGEGNKQMSDHVGDVNRHAFMSQLLQFHPEQQEEINDIWSQIADRSRSGPTSGDSIGATAAKDLFGIIGQKDSWGQPTLEKLNELESALSAQWMAHRDEVTRQRVRLVVSIASQWSHNDDQSPLTLKQQAESALARHATKDVDIRVLMMLKLLGHDPMGVLSAWSTARFPVSALEGRPMGEREEFVVWRVFGDLKSSPFAPQ